MSQRYDVVWADVAENDLKEVIEYVAKDNPANALRIFKKIKQKASGLYKLPERGRIVPELQDQNNEGHFLYCLT